MDHTRHSDIFNAQDLGVTLIGCGGIGATTALTLAKMGVGFLSLYDGDKVDEVNIATQLHKPSDVGRYKAYVLKETLLDFTDGVDVDAHTSRVDLNSRLVDNVIISAVDSIKSRKEIWEAVKVGRCNFYLDARMAAEEFHLNVVWMHGDTAWYEEMLAGETEENVPDLPCTAKATFYTAMISAGHIGNAVKLIANHDIPPHRIIHNIRNNFLMVIP